MMELDWRAGHRPKPGHEAEFQEIIETLLWDRLGRADRAAATCAPRSFLARLFGRPIPARHDRDGIRRRYDEIGISALETLNAPHCDGRSLNSGAAHEDCVGRISFRAQHLTSTTEIIGDHLLAACYEVKFAPDLWAFGGALLVRANAFAKVRKLVVLLAPPDNPDSAEGRLQIVSAAGRWCRFWGERGHFLEPYF